MQSTRYRYRYNGKEQLSRFGGRYDYGFRMYDAGVARFLSVDPLTKKYPELTPYQFGSNRPIDGIDLDGLEWLNSTSVVTMGLNGSAGIGNGFAIGIKAGKAYDMIGVTYFLSTTAETPVTQDLSQGSLNPSMFIGAEAGTDLSVNILFRPTFFQAQDAQLLSMPTSVDVSGKLGPGVGFSFSSDGIGGKVGYGAGASITTGNPDKLINSLSLTYDENKLVSILPDFKVYNFSKKYDKEGKIMGYQGDIKTKNGYIKVSSRYKIDKNNNKISDQNWKSNKYEEAERTIQK